MVFGHRKIQITHERLLITLGLMGIAYETVVTRLDRPALLILFGGMIGLPALALKKDERKDDGTPL